MRREEHSGYDRVDQLQTWATHIPQVFSGYVACSKSPINMYICNIDSVHTYSYILYIQHIFCLDTCHASKPKAQVAIHLGPWEGSEVIKVNRRPAGVSDWKVFFLFLFLACTCSFVLLLRVFASSESSPPPVPLTLGVNFAARLLVHISKVEWVQVMHRQM